MSASHGLRILVCALAVLNSAPANAAWKSHTVRQLNGPTGREVAQPAKLQIISEPWNRVVAVPYVVYMPERDRLLMLVACDYPHRPMLIGSDDRGATWTEPKPLKEKTGRAGEGVFTGLA